MFDVVLDDISFRLLKRGMKETKTGWTRNDGSEMLGCFWNISNEMGKVNVDHAYAQRETGGGCIDIVPFPHLLVNQTHTFSCAFAFLAGCRRPGGTEKQAVGFIFLFLSMKLSSV